MWSLLDGSGTGEQYATRAAELGMPALAITDHGTLAGVLEHVAACEQAGVFPIIGCEIYFRENRLIDPGQDENRFHLTLLAMNGNGWINLQRLTSEAYATGMKYMRGSYKPCADWDLLARYSEGIFCLAGCFNGVFAQSVLRGDEPSAKAIIRRFQSIYGDNFALELQPHDWDDQRIINLGTLRLSIEHGVPMVATGDVHMPYREWTDVHDALLKISTGTSNLKTKKKKAAGEDVFTMEQDYPTLHLMGHDEMLAAFAHGHPDLPQDVVVDAMRESVEIIKRFMPFYMSRDIKMPRLTHSIIRKVDEHGPDVDLNRDPDEIIKNIVKRWCIEGIDDLKTFYNAEHWLKYPVERYQRQLEHEWDVFDQIGPHVWRYMFVVAGEVRWARRNDIIVGAGRGSAAGSLTAYLTGITDIDPLPYDLMFERFINPNRKGMPDIDIDFMPGAEGRDKVVGHTASIYGERNVINIAAYQTYGPKAAIRAVCRVFDDEIDYPTAERYAKVLDQLKPTDRIDLEGCAKRFPEIAQFKSEYPKLWRIAARIEGHPSAQTVHASGVLIKPSEVEIPTAVRIDTDAADKYQKITAWSDNREQLANYGFLKIDYLVIEGLVRQHKVLKALRERENTPIDIRKLPVRYDPYAVDPEVMKSFAKGRTIGVWQMEGKGTIPVLKAVRPDNMHDLAAINALIRPGARGAGITDAYARRKHGIEPVEYWHESVEPILRKTYGLMVYQEQMMEIAVQLGDFTRTEADDLRKAMGKKYREGLPAVIKFLDELGYGPKFIHNASFKVGEEMARWIWEEQCLKFGEYSFNASHAYAYALISYHDMVLKLMAPADFYAGYLTAAKSKDLPDRLKGTMREGAAFDIEIKPPHINKSDADFKVLDRKTILYGLLSVKNIGPTALKAIYEHRPFKDYIDFDESVPRNSVNKLGREALVGAGAFDDWGLRNFMSDEQKASNEEAYLGMRLTGKSDLAKYADLIEDTIHTEDEFDAAKDGDALCVGGEIVGVKPTVTKTQKEMGFVTVAYGTDSIRVTVWPQLWELYSSAFKLGKVVFFEGRKQISERYGPGFIASSCVTLEELVQIKSRRGEVLAA